MADSYSGPRVSSVSLGITVIALYFIFVILVTFGFGSYIYRTSWQLQPANTDVPADQIAIVTDIDNMLFILRREETLERAKTHISGQIALAQVELSQHESRVKQSFGPISRAKRALNEQLAFALDDLAEYQFALPGTARSRYEAVANDAGIDPDSKLRSLLGIIEDGFVADDADIDPDMMVSFEKIRDDVSTKFDELTRARTEANSASLDVQSQKSLVLSKITDLQQRLANHDEVISDLQRALPPASVARARLSALSLNIPFMPDILMRLVSFPTIFLTLIVTIAAGGLGTVVAFSRRYYSSKQASTLTLSRLFVNVGEGIAAAIAIFLFSGAGMLALTQGGGSANDVELSPYTVAFVAFLSGFMAEDAFASIQSAGKRIFKRDQDSESTPKPPAEDDPS